MKFAMGACRLVRIRPACLTTSRGSRRFHASALSKLSKDKNELFVSKYYEGIPMGSVLEFLERKGFTNCKRNGEWINIQSCPSSVCKGSESQKQSKEHPSNQYTFGVHQRNGSYSCFRCNASGNWYDLKKAISGVAYEETLQSASTVFDPKRTIDPVNGVPSSLETRTEIGVGDENVFRKYARALPNCLPAIAWLTEKRCLTLKTLEKFCVGVAIYRFNGRNLMSVTFPWFSPTESELVRVKVRAIEDKKCMKLDPSGNIWGFFGWTTVSEDTTEIVLTEGEIDAMTVYQETGLPSLSLPNGASSLPVELIAMLERFQTIYLWMDDDVPGREGARMCLKKLGRHRCKVVWCRDGGNSGPKDANDALQLLRSLQREHKLQIGEMERRLLGIMESRSAESEEYKMAEMEIASTKRRFQEEERKYEISTILSKAQIVPHDHILRFEDIRREIQEQLTSYNSISGISFGSALPTLTKILKGHRPGEFTIVTGRTGQGKTTMLSQLSIDLCEQGVHTLWGSFEIKNARLGAKMLQQHSKKSLRGCSDREFNDAADAFSQLPLWFLSYYGTTDIDDVLDAMEFAVYSKDVKHVVLDNLQFMTSGAYRESDTFKILDQAIHKLRLFATDFNVHISLVIHPRKDDESQLLTLSSIFGTAKATQESDNVIILQTNGAIKYLDIRKNRFDGSLGCVPFKFNEKTLRYEEMEPDEVLAMEQEYANSL